MNHITKAIQIITSHGLIVRKAVDKSKGCDHKIILLYTNKGNFVYRYCKNDKAIMSHTYAVTVWSQLKMPKILIKKKYYLIETMIKGKDMSESRLTHLQKICIMKQIGKIMKEMHKTKTKRYGYMIRPGVGQVNNWNKYIVRLTRRRVKKLPSYLNRLINNYLKHNAVHFAQPVLLHKDINPENIIVYRGKLSGIIDAADAVSGDPAYDIAIMYDRFRRWPKEYPDALVNAYGKVNKKRLAYYAVINSVRRIYQQKTQKKPIKTYVKELEKLLYSYRKTN